MCSWVTSAEETGLAAERVFRKFTRYDLVQPNPPLWSYVWIDNHPTVVQRIAMAQAYGAR